MPFLSGASASHPVLAAGEAANPWFSWQYVQDNAETIVSKLGFHIGITLETVVIAMLIAFPLAVLSYRYR